jgi:hypothetical protein
MFIQRNPNIICRKVGSQWIILENNRSNVRQLNTTASFIWGLAVRPISIDTIVKKVYEKYGTTDENVRTDVNGFIKDYLKHGYLVEFDSK